LRQFGAHSNVSIEFHLRNLFEILFMLEGFAMLWGWDEFVLEFWDYLVIFG
jgi:hypothetical protein